MLKIPKIKVAARRRLTHSITIRVCEESYALWREGKFRIDGLPEEGRQVLMTYLQQRLDEISKKGQGG